MNITKLRSRLVAIAFTSAVAAGLANLGACGKQSGEAGAERSAPAAVPKPKPAGELKLSGLTMIVPPGWVQKPVSSGPLAPKAAFDLPKSPGDTAACTVRITHYPNMKGMKGIDKMNIRRWLSQVTRPDGSPSTREDANISVKEVGHVRTTTVDLTGSVRSGMGPAGVSLPNHRLIAAIVDHPHGPHFVKAMGPVGAMKQSQDSIYAFLASATTD